MVRRFQVAILECPALGRVHLTTFLNLLNPVPAGAYPSPQWEREEVHLGQVTSPSQRRDGDSNSSFSFIKWVNIGDPALNLTFFSSWTGEEV